jgi:hypothetical protein
MIEIDLGLRSSTASFPVSHTDSLEFGRRAPHVSDT